MPELGRYHIYLDYKGYQIDPASYRVFPAPLMGTRFATGRAAYSNLDFWQTGAITDFTKGINQKFLVDPSQYYYSEGIDVSQEGEIKLERDLQPISFPSTRGIVTARYRALDGLYLGTSTGWVLKTTDGVTFTDEVNTGTGKIYSFYEMKGDFFAVKGSYPTWRRTAGNWFEMTEYNAGTVALTNSSTSVTGTGTNWNQGHVGRVFRITGETVSYIVTSVTSATSLTLDKPYEGTTGSGKTYKILGITDLYFTMIESDTAFGIFNDGVRQSLDGLSWIPEPPDPLWSLPSSEGTALNAIPIQRGFLIGARRGLWIFLGGGSAVNVWFFPDFVNDNNFRAMEKFAIYGVFSVEGQGIWYTDGSGIYPTNLNSKEQPFKVVSCVSIILSGWDLFALISDGTDWYLARSNLIYTRVPKYWWIVKKLTKVPVFLSAFSEDKVFVHYDDTTCEVYDKLTGPFQTSGYLISPLIDENLVLLRKLYRDVSCILSEFPADTSVSLAFRLNETDAFDETSFSSTAGLSLTKILPNPTVGNRIQIRAKLSTTNTAVSPVLTDLLWSYILELPAGQTIKRNWHFTVLAENILEKLDFDKEELGREKPRTAADILNDLWATKNKIGLLNFVGVDNELKKALKISYTGNGASCTATIDRTNFQIKTYVDGVLDKTFNYENQTLSQLASAISAEADYSASVEQESNETDSANNLVPDTDLQLRGGATVYQGTDVHSVIMNPQAPGQFKLSIGERGQDRIQISLREA